MELAVALGTGVALRLTVAANRQSSRCRVDMREWVQIIISVVLLIASLFVVLSPKYGPKDKHWAYGTIGTLVGFWLRQ